MHSFPIILMLTLALAVSFNPFAFSEDPPEPYHPCLSAGIKKSVVFIGSLGLKNGSDEEYEPSYFGTGFLLHVDDIYYLVTARHVIYEFRERGGKDEQIFIFLNGKDGKIRGQSIAHLKTLFKIDWVFGKEADVAIIPFGITQEYDVKFVPEDLFLESSQFLELQDLFFISFQPGIGAPDRIAPVTRKGMVSLVNSDGTFYMDAFAFPGNSGSPVFIKPSPATFTKGGTAIGDPYACRFVGLIGEYLTYQEMAISKQTKRPRVIFEENTGIAKVWPVQTLQSILLSAEFQNQHREVKTKTAVAP